MGGIIGIHQEILDKFPNQQLTISSPFGALVSLYKDEEFGISGGLEYKSVKDIIDEVSNMGSDLLSSASSMSSTVSTITNVGSSMLNLGGNAKQLASGFRDEATPWMGFKKAIAHNHGNITLNFIITKKLKDAKNLLNKMSMQEIDGNGMWTYAPTDSLKTLFTDSSGEMSSLSALTTASRGAMQNFKDLEGKLAPKLMTVTIGKWFKADKLIINSIDYRIKTAVFDDNGSPEYMEVTMNLEPIRKLSATEISSWFPNLHNKG